MNENVIIERLVNNIIDYTVQARERVYNNVRQEMVNYYWKEEFLYNLSNCPDVWTI